MNTKQHHTKPDRKAIEQSLELLKQLNTINNEINIDTPKDNSEADNASKDVNNILEGIDFDLGG